MFIFACACLGAIIGGMTAYKRQGNRLDIAQYAAGYAMAFTVVSMIIAVVLDRLLI